MAITHTKRALEVVVHDATMLELITRQIPEGASQTFPAGSPVAISSGLAVVFVAPATALLAGIAIKAGQNTTLAYSDVVLAIPGVAEIEANFLGAAAADNVLAAADFGSKFDLLSSSTLIGGASAGWYISDATADPSVRICEFPSVRVANESQVKTKLGDTNARVRAAFIATKTHWDAT